MGSESTFIEGVRRHYVAESEGRVVGYGSIEKPDDDSNMDFEWLLTGRMLMAALEDSKASWERGGEHFSQGETCVTHELAF